MPSPYPYFPFYAADWMTDTAMMSPTAKGIYITLLCYQWINGDIPADEMGIWRLSGVGSFDEFSEQFWPEIKHKFRFFGSDGEKEFWHYKNPRLERERQKTIEKAEKAARAGRASGAARRKALIDQDERTDVELGGNQSESESESEEEINYPTGSSSPQLTLDGDPPDRVPNCPHEKIRELYNKVCSPPLPRCKLMTASRRDALRRRWAEHPDLDWWERYFTYVHEECPFLNGERQSDRERQGIRPFMADFDWLIKPANMTKVIEEKYQR